MISTLLKTPLPIFSLLASAVALTACGGGSGGDTSKSDGSAALVPAGGSATSSDNLSDRDIQKAASDAMKGMVFLDETELGATFNPAEDSPLDLTEDEGMSLDEEGDIEDVDLLVGLSDASHASITREGNVLLIDFDENTFCSENSEPENQEACVSAMKHVTASIDATSDDSGVLSYSYRDDAFFRIGYAPNAASMEIRMNPFLGFAVDQQAYLQDDFSEQPVLPESLKGALRISAAADPESPDDLGSVSFSISEPIEIVSSEEGVSFEVASATLFSIGMTPTGGAFEFDTGAAKISGPWNDDEVSTADYVTPGFTGKAEIREEDGLITVSNLGLSKGPLTITTSSGDALELTMEKFGFTVAEGDNEVVLTGDLNLSVLVNNVLGTLAVDDPLTDLLFSVVAPLGSAIPLSSEGPVQLLRGGPFTVSVGATRGEDVVDSTVTVEAGSCFDTPYDDESEDNNPLIAIVPCQ